MRVYSTQQVAELYGVESWRVRRLFELGILNEPPRLAGHRIIAQALLAEIAIALRDRGWLPATDVTAGDSSLKETLA
jgi:hypothetical protein